MNVKCSDKVVLRFFAIGMLTIVLFVFMVTIVFSGQRVGYHVQNVATEGYLDLTEESIYKEPAHMNGWWERFDGVVCASESEVRALGEADNLVHFPLGTITQAQKNATYRLRFSIPKDRQERFHLYIPNFYKSAHVYLNGVEQNYIQDGEPWLVYSALESVIPLVDILPDQEWQELVITGAFEEQPVTLYKRPIIIGTMKNIAALVTFSSANEMFLVGLLLLIMINGYVFMMFRPEHKIISLMTLFDTMILMRTVLAMNYVISFLKDIFPWLPISDRISVSAMLFFLMLGGIVGCVLSTAIYDPDKKVPKWLITPMPWIYAAFAVVFPLNPSFFEQYGKYLLMVVYVITFVGVFMQYRVSREIRERRTYNLLQFSKTIYIGTLIFIDIICWNMTTDFLILFYLYSVFFVLHVIVRLYDNNESYQDVEKLNAGLENTVRQRTNELSEANRVLAELSIKDPLTQIFNRLHFERTMEAAIASASQGDSLYLCIFDLDFFKKINDTYGHVAGDEQLKSMVKLVSESIGENTIFARFGGEEFVLLFQGLGQDAVLKCIQEVHHAIEKDARGNHTHTTASFGIASFRQGDTAKQLLNKADLALYEAKHLGRNRIVTNFNEELLEFQYG